MGTWANDPAGGQVWQPSQFQAIPAQIVNGVDGGLYWEPASQYTLDPDGPYPGGGTKYEYAAGAAIPSWQDASGGWYQKLNDGYWYYHTRQGADESGQPDNGLWNMRRRWSDADMRALAPGLQYWARINDPTDHDGGPDLGMLATFVAIAAAGGAFSGMLAPGGASAGASASAAAETAAMDAWLGTDIALTDTATAAASTATTGATSMDGINGFSSWLESYSSDPGIDPFATTADVNAGWSFDGGYPGVDWYNSAGVGEAAASSSLDGILGTINKVSTTVNSAIRTLSGTAAQVKNNLATPAPNYTRAAGGINVLSLIHISEPTRPY